jgi:hypothetical protein
MPVIRDREHKSLSKTKIWNAEAAKRSQAVDAKVAKRHIQHGIEAGNVLLHA